MSTSATFTHEELQAIHGRASLAQAKHREWASDLLDRHLDATCELAELREELGTLRKLRDAVGQLARTTSAQRGPHWTWNQGAAFLAPVFDAWLACEKGALPKREART